MFHKKNTTSHKAVVSQILRVYWGCTPGPFWIIQAAGDGINESLIDLLGLWLIFRIGIHAPDHSSPPFASVDKICGCQISILTFPRATSSLLTGFKANVQLFHWYPTMDVEICQNILKIQFHTSILVITHDVHGVKCITKFGPNLLTFIISDVFLALPILFVIKRIRWVPECIEPCRVDKLEIWRSIGSHLLQVCDELFVPRLEIIPFVGLQRCNTCLYILAPNFRRDGIKLSSNSLYKGQICINFYITIFALVLCKVFEIHVNSICKRVLNKLTHKLCQLLGILDTTQAGPIAPSSKTNDAPFGSTRKLPAHSAEITDGNNTRTGCSSVLLEVIDGFFSR